MVKSYHIGNARNCEPTLSEYEKDKYCERLYPNPNES